jgi:hypothetical protein
MKIEELIKGIDSLEAIIVKLAGLILLALILYNHIIHEARLI